jgi:hypothetical protein
VRECTGTSVRDRSENADDVGNAVYPRLDHAYQWSHDPLKWSHDDLQTSGVVLSSIPSQMLCGLRNMTLTGANPSLLSVCQNHGGCGFVQ